MKVKEILGEATFTSHMLYNPNDDSGPYSMTNPGNEDISYAEQEEQGEQFCLYFDKTGSGTGPEPVAGPFDSEDQAKAYAAEYEIPLTGDNYFIDVYRGEPEEEEELELYNCNDCSGTGEGQYDGSICRTCKGSGVIDNRDTERDPDEARDRQQDRDINR